MTVVFLSLPAELICHILLLLTPRDICRCAVTCKTVCNAALNSVDIQYKLELYAQGFTETATLDSVDLSTKMSSIKKLASLWRSDFHAKTVFEEVILGTVDGESFSGKPHMTYGVWWMWTHGNLYIRDCNANVKLSRTWPTVSFFAQWQRQLLRSVIIDPLQDIVIIVSSEIQCMVTNAGLDHQVFVVEFRLASSPKLPYPDAACTFLECKHAFDFPGQYVVTTKEPAICGDRVVILYYVLIDMFIQVIDWKKGLTKSYPLGLKECRNEQAFRLVDKQTMVVVSSEGLLTLYTLRALDGSPQCRITYLLPKMRRYSSPSYVIHSTPLFHSTEARPDLMPGYMPSLESQIMVLEVHFGFPVILVIDMVIFTAQAIHSETPVIIPWSDWGTQYTRCFPHHESYKISVFGSKMAYILSVPYVPEPGQRLEGFSTEPDPIEQDPTGPIHFSTNADYFYVHIWDFNERAIARTENAYYRNSQRPLICRPGDIAHPDLLADTLSDRPYIATVCCTPFKFHGFHISDLNIFLEQDRFTLTWSHEFRSPLNIQVVCPVQTEAGTELVD